MSDLIERLRKAAWDNDDGICNVAADRIEALEEAAAADIRSGNKLAERIEALEKALRCFWSFNEIMGDLPDDSDIAMAQAKYVEGIELTRAALGGKTRAELLSEIAETDAQLLDDDP